MANTYLEEIQANSEERRKNLRNALHPYRTMLIQVLSVFFFYFFGILFYHHNMGWNIVDCIYFITVSITTVGYGDYSVDNDNGRIFTIFYVLIGLVYIFSIINDFAQSIISAAEAKALEKLDDDPTDYKEPHAAKIGLSIFAIVLCVMIGTLFFKYNENWSFVKALYWSFITTVTVGYGDLTLEYESSRIFSIFYIITSVIVVAGAIGNFGAVQLAIENEKKKEKALNKELDLESLLAMDTDGGGVDMVEFLTFMLVEINGLNKEKDIDPWIKRFKELDADNSGALDHEDLRIFAEAEAARKEARRRSRESVDRGKKNGSFHEPLLG